MASFLRQDDSPEGQARQKAKDKALDLPAQAKNICVILAQDLKQAIVMSLLDSSTGRADHIIRSDDVGEEVRFNLKMWALMKEHEIDVAKDTAYYCDDCEEGDFFWCDYRTYGDRLSCPEHRVQTKTAMAETKKATDNKKARDHEKDVAWVSYMADEALDAKIDKEIEDEDKLKARLMDVTKPVSVLPPAGDGTGFKPWKTAAPSNPVKTGFQIPKGNTGGTGTIPSGTFFRCMFCWHWFENESRLAGHVMWCCPARDGNTPDSQHTVIKCVCESCKTLEDRLVSRKPPEEVVDTTTDPTKASSGNGTEQAAVPDGSGKEDKTTD